MDETDAAREGFDPIALTEQDTQPYLDPTDTQETLKLDASTVRLAQQAAQREADIRVLIAAYDAHNPVRAMQVILKAWRER